MRVQVVQQWGLAQATASGLFSVFIFGYSMIGEDRKGVREERWRGQEGEGMVGEERTVASPEPRILDPFEVPAPCAVHLPLQACWPSSGTAPSR